MALKTDYLDDILNADINTRRKYNIIQNDDGTVSFEDVTEYSQVGTVFGAEQVNEITREVNRSKNELDEKISKNDIVDNLVSTATKLPLSAKQGGVLDGKISTLDTNFNNLLKTAYGTSTTGSSGNINLNIGSASGKVISAHANGYMCLPFVSSSRWYIKVVDANTLAAVANTEISYQVIYVDKSVS